MNAKLALRKALAQLLYTSKTSSFFSRPVPWRVLMYHRIIQPEEVPYPVESGMYVTPDTFRIHVEYLKIRCNVVPLSELVEKISSGAPIPKRTVALTFDDGWADNYQYAYPLLRKAGLPWTLFLATGFIGENKLFWTDEAAVFLRWYLQHRVEGERELRRSLPEERANALCKLLAASCTETELLDPLLRYLFLQPPTERRQIIEVMKSTHHTLTPRAFLAWEEVREMAQDGVAFGSHTHDHLLLSEEPEKSTEQAKLSLERLSQEGVRPISVFCYPGGKWSNETQRHLLTYFSSAVTVVRDSQLTTFPRLIGRTGIHNDITSTAAMLEARLFADRRFF